MLAEILSSLTEPSVLAMLVVVFVAGLTRGFAGFGGGLIYVPIASAVFGPQVAAATALLYDIPVSIPFTIRLLPRANIRDVIPLAIGGCTATPIGYLALTRLEGDSVQWITSIAVLSAVAAIAAGVRLKRDTAATAVGVGLASGFLNGMAQIGGPPIILYWLSKATAAMTVRASALLYYQFGTAVTLTIYLIGGLITREVLLLTAVMVPVYTVAMILGGRMFGLTSERTYRRIAFALITLSGLAGLPIWGR